MARGVRIGAPRRWARLASRRRGKPRAPAETVAHADDRRRNPAAGRTASPKAANCTINSAWMISPSSRRVRPARSNFAKRQEHAAIDRLEMHGQRPERRGQRRMQADRAARILGGGGLQRSDLVAADRRPHHHHRCGIEPAALDQVADRAVDAGTDAVVVGAQPDTARRRRRSFGRGPFAGAGFFSVSLRGCRPASRCARRRNRSGALSAPRGSCRYIRRRCRS